MKAANFIQDGLVSFKRGPYEANIRHVYQHLSVNVLLVQAGGQLKLACAGNRGYNSIGWHSSCVSSVNLVVAVV
jgi:hypothetical protein